MPILPDKFQYSHVDHILLMIDEGPMSQAFFNNHGQSKQYSIVLILFFVLGSDIPDVSADPSLTKYFSGLRQRQLFRLAESACLRRLAEERTSPEMRGQVTLELSRTYADHAKYSVGNQQSRLWKLAKSVIDDRLKLDTDLAGSQRYWLRVQRAVVAVLEGEFQRWDVKMFPRNSAILAKARVSLKDASAQLRLLETELTIALRRARQRLKSQPADVSVAELKSLLRYVRYQLGVAQVNQAVVFPAGSAERKAMISQVEPLLNDLTNGISDMSIAWNSQVLLAVTLRLSGEYRRALVRLKAIEKKKPPVSVIDRTIAERVKLLLSLKSFLEAEKMLETYRRQRGELPGELAFLSVKTDLLLSSLALNGMKPAIAKSYFQQAQAHVNEAERALGGYWGYRCRVVVESAKDDFKYGPKLADAIRKAVMLRDSRQLAEAAREYGVAANIAKQTRKPNIAVELRFEQAALHLGLDHFSKAAESYRQISSDQPAHTRAADAHLLWAYCLGRMYDEDRTKVRRLAYMNALEDHRKQFPKSATEWEAAWMLATLQEHRLQTTEALKLYLLIPVTHSRGKSAQVAVARCYEGVLERLRELKRPKDLDAWEKHAIFRLGKIVNRFPLSPEPLELTEAEIAMRLARICLNRSQPDYVKTERLLKRVLESSPKIVVKITPELKQNRELWNQLTRIARQLRIVSLAGSGRMEQARKSLTELSSAGTAEVLAVLDGLMQLTTGSNEKTRRQLGILQIQTAIALDQKRKSLTKTEQAWLDRCLAQAYVSAGQPSRAITYYEQLLAKSPGDLRLLRTTAELLLQSDNPMHLKKGKAFWRKLESSAKKGSSDWLTARYSIALASYRLKEHDECRKLLTVTKLLYPRLGSEKLRKKYAELLADVNRQK
jgi:tetratricopeptide (TPR) repeat protein